MEEPIEVRVLPHTGVLQTVTVRRSDSLSVIYNHVPEQDAHLVHRGHVLSPSFSFAYQGVESGDTINVVQKIQSATPRRQCQRARPNPSLFELKRRALDAFQSYDDLSRLTLPELRHLYAKTRDNYFSKVEGNAFSHRQLLLKFSLISERPDSPRTTERQTSVVLTSDLKSPASQALPEFWKRKKKS